jgi:hypothetical protein
MYTMSIQKDQLTYDKDSRTFTAELSDTRLQSWDRGIFIPFMLWNEETNKFRVFNPLSVDWTGSVNDREIAGWRFHNKSHDLDLLLIND